MADPLSIVASVLALITAAGKTAQGLQKAWELRHMNEDFTGLLNEITGLRTQLHVVRISLEQFSHKDHIKSIIECCSNIHGLCIQANSILLEIDKLVDKITRRSAREQHVTTLTLSKRSWLRRRSSLLRLTSRLSPIVTALTVTANFLRDMASHSRLDTIVSKMSIEKVEMLGASPSVENETSLPSAQLDHVLRYAVELEDTSSKALKTANQRTSTVSRKTSTDSFHSALSSSSDSELSYISITGSVSTRNCEPFCPCQCHVSKNVRTPLWMQHIVGAMTIHGNGSIFLGRRPCNKACRRSGPTSLRVSYLAPSWLLLKNLNIYFMAQSMYDNDFAMKMPHVIPNTAPVWSMIELGKLSKLQEMLDQRLVYLYDVTSSGRSLLNYAAVKGQIRIYEFLVKLGADPYFRDCTGITSNQPGVDRALTGTSLDRVVSKSARSSSYDLFTTQETLDQQEFDFLHLVVLGLRNLNLGLVLKQYIGPRNDIDVRDVNGRTPLIWAAWRGDLETLDLLISSHANPNQIDNEGYTAISRAAKAGHLDCVRSLLKGGAELKIANNDGYQPLHHASGNKLHGLLIVDELLAHGADVHAVCCRGTSLHLAANRGSPDIIKRLLQAGSDINAQDPDGDTPAMMALFCWNEPAFTCLMNAGATLNVARRNGENILHLLTWVGSVSLWDTVAGRARDKEIAGLDTKSLHDGHELQHCFENCREMWYVGTREAKEVEEAKFHRMLDAFIM